MYKTAFFYNRLKKYKNEDFLFIIYTVIFKSTLEYIYLNIFPKELNNIQILFRAFLRGGFSFEINYYKYIISWIIYIFFMIIFKKKIYKFGNKAHEVIFLGLLLMSFTPSISLFALSNLDYGFLFILCFYWIIFLCFTYFFCNKLSSKKSISIVYIPYDVKNILFKIIIFIFFIGSLIFSYIYNGLNINLGILLEEVYLNRLAARQLNIPTIINYFRNNAMYIVIPLVSILTVKQKKYIYFIGSILVQALLYSFDMQKGALFLFIVSLVSCFWIDKKFVVKIPKVLSLANIILILIYKLTNNIFFVDNLAKRIYFLPAIISNCYYLYFNLHDKVIPFSTLFIKSGILNNYEYKYLAAPFVIGGKYFASSQISANTGSVGAALSYGIIGVILIPIAYAILLRAMNNVTTNIKFNYYISILIMQMYAIVGSNIFTVITVYGYGLSLLLLHLMNNNKKFFNN